MKRRKKRREVKSDKRRKKKMTTMMTMVWMTSEIKLTEVDKQQHKDLPVNQMDIIHSLTTLLVPTHSHSHTHVRTHKYISTHTHTHTERGREREREVHDCSQFIMFHFFHPFSSRQQQSSSFSFSRIHVFILLFLTLIAIPKKSTIFGCFGKRDKKFASATTSEGKFCSR